MKEWIPAAATLLGVLIGHLVTSLNSISKLKNESITQERSKWRDAIRQLSHEFSSKKFVTSEDIIFFRNSFAIRLNPEDWRDQLIIQYFDCLETCINKNTFITIKQAMNTQFYIENCSLNIQEDNDTVTPTYTWDTLISSLLKHDWERSKFEADYFKQAPILLLNTTIVYFTYHLLNVIHKNKYYMVPKVPESIFYVILSLLIFFYIIRPLFKWIKNNICYVNQILAFFQLSVQHPIKSNYNNCDELLTKLCFFKYLYFLFLTLLILLVT